MGALCPDVEIEDEIEAIDLEFVREDLPKLVGSMSEGVDRICNISTSLRTFSRTDRDTPVAFNLHEGLDSTILILKHRLKANENRPEIQVIKNYGQIPTIEGFAGQLNQVFMNFWQMRSTPWKSRTPDAVLPIFKLIQIG